MLKWLQDLMILILLHISQLSHPQLLAKTPGHREKFHWLATTTWGCCRKAQDTSVPSEQLNHRPAAWKISTISCFSRFMNHGWRNNPPRNFFRQWISDLPISAITPGPKKDWNFACIHCALNVLVLHIIHDNYMQACLNSPPSLRRLNAQTKQNNSNPQRIIPLKANTSKWCPWWQRKMSREEIEE